MSVGMASDMGGAGRANCLVTNTQREAFLDVHCMSSSSSILNILFFEGFA